MHDFLFLLPSELKSCNSGTYTDRINEPGILTVINCNKILIKPYIALVDIVLAKFREDILTWTHLPKEENGEVIQPELQPQLDMNESSVSNSLPAADYTIGNA